MNKTLFNTVPMALVMLASFSACSNDDMQDNGNGDTQLNIKLSETSESNDATRFIMADSYVVDSQQVDLGNGYVADMVITKDPTETNENTTRGYGDGDGGTYAAAVGTYAIRAYDSNNTGKTYTGEWNGTTFTKTGNWDIKAGSYKMFCYQPSGWTTNVSGNNLKLSMSTETSNLVKQNRAVLSDMVNANISASSNTVAFNLKHKATGIRVKFVSEATSYSTAANLVDIVANFKTSFVHTKTFTLPTDLTGNMTSTSATVDKTLTLTNNTSDYVYIPTGISTNIFYLNFSSGKAKFPLNTFPDDTESFDINLANKNLVLPEFTTVAGERYTVNITIKTSLSMVNIGKKIADSSETPKVAESWGDGTFEFSSLFDVWSAKPYKESIPYLLFANKDGKVNVTPKPNEHSLIEKLSTGSVANDVYYTTNDVKPITIQPSTNDGGLYLITFLKKWQETAGVKYLRTRLEEGQKILLAENNNHYFYFYPYSENSYFATVSKADGTKDRQETFDDDTSICYEFAYDNRSQIYTITIHKDASICASTSCTDIGTSIKVLLRCPVTCSNLKISDSLK